MPTNGGGETVFGVEYIAPFFAVPFAFPTKADDERIKIHDRKSMNARRACPKAVLRV